MTKTITILFLSANPKTVSRLDLEREVEAIRSRIESQQNSDRLELIPYFAATKELLRAALLKHRPHVLHFSGHGSPTKGILLEDPNGDVETVALDAIADLISIIKDNLRVVVLNACYSALLADGISKTVEAAIGMRHQIGDSAAIEFAAAFYEALANGRSVGASFEIGRNALPLARIPQAHIPALLEGLGVEAHKLYLTDGPGSPASLRDQSHRPPSPDPNGTMQIDVIVLEGGTNNKIEAWRYATGVNQHCFITLDGLEQRLSPQDAWESLALKINRLAAAKTDSPMLPVDVFLFLRCELVEIDLKKFKEILQQARDHTWGSNIYVAWNQQTRFITLYGDNAAKLEGWFHILLESGVTDLIEITKRDRVREDDEIALMRLLRDCASKSVARRERMMKLVSGDAWGLSLRDGAYFLDEFLKKFFKPEAAAAKCKNLIVFYDQKPPKSWIQLVEKSRIFDRSGNWFVSLGRNDNDVLKILKPFWEIEKSEVTPALFDDIFVFGGAFEWLYSVIRLREAGTPAGDESVSSGKAEAEWMSLPNKAVTPRHSHQDDLRLLITSIFVLHEAHFISSGYAQVVVEQQKYFLEAAKEVGALLRNLKFNVAVEVFHSTAVDQLAALVEKEEFTAWLFLGHRGAPSEVREQFAHEYADPDGWLYRFQPLKAGGCRLAVFSSFASTAIARKVVASGAELAVGFDDQTQPAHCQGFSSVLIPMALEGQPNDAILMEFSRIREELSMDQRDGNKVKPRIFAFKRG